MYDAPCLLMYCKRSLKSFKKKNQLKRYFLFKEEIFEYVEFKDRVACVGLGTYYNLVLGQELRVLNLNRGPPS
jgi:hypothetical protein